MFNFGIGKNQIEKVKKSNFGFGINKEEPQEKTKVSILPEFLGGGSFTTAIGQPNKLVKTPRKDTIDTKFGFEVSHTVPVSLGGVSTKENVGYQNLIPENKRTSEFNLTEADKYLNDTVLPKYRAGELSLPQARMEILTFQQQHYDSKGLYHKDAGVETNGKWQITNTAGNFWQGLKEVFTNPIQSIREAVKVNPQTTQAIKDVFESTKPKTPSVGGIVSSLYQGIKEPVVEEGKRIKDYYGTVLDKNVPTAEKASRAIKVATGGAGVLFSPITALFSASKDIPVLNTITSLVNVPLAVIGDTATNQTDEALNGLVASGAVKKETADTLKGALEEITSLAGQIVVGGAVFRKGGEFLNKKKELEATYGKKDAETIIAKAEEKAKVETINNELTSKLTEKATGLKKIGVVPQKPALTKIGNIVLEKGGVKKIGSLKPELAPKPPQGEEIAPTVGKTADNVVDPLIQEAKKVEVNPKTEQLKSSVWERMKEENPLLKGEVSYEKSSIKGEIDKAVSSAEKNPQEAYRTAMGYNDAKQVDKVAANIALSEKALENKEYKIAADLIKQRSMAQTERGQAIVLERALTDNATDIFVKQLIRQRMSDVTKKTFSLIKKGENKLKSVVDGGVKKVKEKVKTAELNIKEAQDFINSLACK